MNIRRATLSDLDDVLAVERAAFGEEGVASLVNDLLNDTSAEPVISLLAFQEKRAVGHILFTDARLEPKSGLSVYILAPLAVVPELQKQGIGKALAEAGLQILSQLDVDLVFVLGYPQYYRRFGFKPAGPLGFSAPYPIPEKNADAWMVLGLNSGAIDSCNGTVICADAMNKPEHWLE